MTPLPAVTLARLKKALEASWQPDTAYQAVSQTGNPALGQCYPTARVVQWFFPRFEIAAGEVDTGSSREAHFWNVDPATYPAEHVDLTRGQFPPSAEVIHWRLLDRAALGDSPRTIIRCELLLSRVLAALS